MRMLPRPGAIASGVFARARPRAFSLELPEGRGLSSSEISADALGRWNGGLRAAGETRSDNVIEIFGTIGEDWWTGEGTTVKSVTKRLKEIGDRDIEVHINSPGGDMFEGIGIFNVLQAHKGRVTVKIMGLAASAASIIAMAGDDVRVGVGAFIMIHNCWVVAIGNRHAMKEVAEYLGPFDKALNDIYHDRTECEVTQIAKWMDDETFFSASQAIEHGFADGMMAEAEVAEDPEAAAAAKRFNVAREMESRLTRDSGMSRSQARALINSLTAAKQSAGGGSNPAGKPGAAAETQPATPGAGDTEAVMKAVAELKRALTG